MRPVQPYFTLSSTKYYKRPETGSPISHIYEYTYDDREDRPIIAIPDGCIDIMIDVDSPEDMAEAAGTVLDGTGIPSKPGHHYIGVRFLPGQFPAFLDGKPGDFNNTQIDLSLCSPRAKEMIDGVLSCRNFSDRADFLENFVRRYGQAEPPNSFEKAHLASFLRGLIEKSRGHIRVEELAEETGYSVRYVNRVFTEFSGISPKTFGNIVRFQAAIDTLDHAPDMSLTTLAIDSGYYDEAQFIRDFHRYAVLTPGKYRNELIRSDYANRFILS